MASLPVTTPGIEVAVARLLGVEADVATEAVATMEERGLLGHGVLLLGVLAAARWGTDLSGALRRIGDGDAPPESWSAYEARVAGEEAADEAGRALAAVRVEPDRSQTVDSALGCVEALLAGQGTIVLDGEGPAAERAWIERLCVCVGAMVLPDAWRTDDVADVVARAADALDVLDV